MGPGVRGREINRETWRNEEKDNEEESKEEIKKRLVEKAWSCQVNCHNGRLEEREEVVMWVMASFQVGFGWLHCVSLHHIPQEA